jgi:hypothetical protein
VVLGRTHCVPDSPTPALVGPARLGCGHIHRLRKERGKIPTSVGFRHFQFECRALDRVGEREPEVVETPREFEKVTDAALRGASPPEDQWGPVAPVDVLHVVCDVKSWAVTNFEPVRSQPVAPQFTGQQSLGSLQEFRRPYRGNPPWDLRVGATPINHVFNPSMRRAALWTAYALLARQHPRRPHQSCALSLGERRRRIFRYQNGKSLSWLVAQTSHWPGGYVRHHWNRLADVREGLG